MAEPVATSVRSAVPDPDAAPEPAVLATGLIRIHPSPTGPVPALRGLDLEIGRGELAAVVGPSGSGKSTLLRLLAGLDRPSAGQLRVLGTDLVLAGEAELDRHRRERVAVVEQHYRRSLSPYLTIGRAIELPLALRGVDGATARARADELLDRIGLSARREAMRGELSGGEQQRVALAVALAARPALLLADEPTGELDQVTAEGVLELLRELVRSEGTTCLVVTHDELVEGVADRVVQVQDGRAIATRRGGVTTRATDAEGWLAPVPPAASTPLAAAVRDGAEGLAVVLEGAARRYGRGGRGSIGLPPVTAAFRRGGFHVVTGPSGSGKTTLLRLIVGLDRPTVGRVVTLDTDLAGLDREALAAFRAGHLGMVDQARDLVPFLSALENVELGLAIRGRTGDDARERSREALAGLGLGARLDRTPSQLSAGERLRVAVARALAAGPDLLVLDEPTATLDRDGSRAVARLLAGLDPAVTVIATTHDPALIEAASDRIDLRAAIAGSADAA